MKSAPAMDAVNAKRLMEAWRASLKDTAKVKGEWYAPKSGYSEAEFDAKQKVLSLRRAPVGFGAADRGEREAFAKAVSAKKGKLLAGTTSEVVRFRSKPKEGWFIVLRMDFGDPTMSDADFLDASRRLSELTRAWRE